MFYLFEKYAVNNSSKTMPERSVAILAQAILAQAHFGSTAPLPCSHFGAIKAMRAMKAMEASNVMTTPTAYGSVAETCGLKTKDVKTVMGGIFEVAAEQLKKIGSLKIVGALNLELKNKLHVSTKFGFTKF